MRRLVAVDRPKALKDRVLSSVITARVKGPVPDLDIPGIVIISRDGDRVSCSTKEGASALPVISDALSAAGGRVVEMTIREPTLDDVFLTLVGTPEESSRFDYTKFRTMLRRRR